MAKDPLRAFRDEQARALHRELATKGGHRILARGKDGELHSYTLDEYGNSTHGLESQVRSVWGMTILSVAMVALTLGCVVAFVVSFTSPEGPVWFALLAVAVMGAFTWIGGQATLREARAKALRRKRGLPDPIK